MKNLMEIALLVKVILHCHSIKIFDFINVYALLHQDIIFQIQIIHAINAKKIVKFVKVIIYWFFIFYFKNYIYNFIIFQIFVDIDASECSMCKPSYSLNNITK